MPSNYFHIVFKRGLRLRLGLFCIKRASNASFIFFSLFFSTEASAQEKDHTNPHLNVFNVSIENDSRNIGGPGSDKSYTNEFRFSYTTTHSPIPLSVEKYLSKTTQFFNPDLDFKKNYGLSLGQQIYTPTNITTSKLLKNDRPYAAWLYLGLLIQLSNRDSSHVLALDIGTIGPQALGKDVQNGFHNIIGTGEGNGWNNQLKNEKTLQFFYQQRRRLSKNDISEKSFYDLIPYYGYSVGNVHVNAHIGCLLRLGTDLAMDYGPTRLSEHDGDSFLSSTRNLNNKKSHYYFIGGRGLLVFKDIFLDGNTFRDSPGVHKIPTLTELEIGIVGELYNWKMIWQYVTKSPEFYENYKFSSFASISISTSF